MAIYDYECEKCGATFEVRRNLTEEETTEEDKVECARCGSAQTRRVYSSFSTDSSCSTSPMRAYRPRFYGG